MPGKLSQPYFLLLLAVIFSFHAVFIPVFSLGLMLADDSTTMLYNGERIRIDDYRLSVIAPLLIWWPFALACAYGIWKKKVWARPTILSIFVVPGFLFSAVETNWSDPGEFVMGALLAVPFWFYLYRKQTVRDYFDVTQHRS